MPKPKLETQRTRPDLDDQQWLAWLAAEPENRGIDVHRLYRKMLAWCDQKRVTPTRRRLLNWLSTELENMPMTYVPATNEEQPPAPAFEAEPPCSVCGKEICFALHREERGI